MKKEKINKSESETEKKGIKISKKNTLVFTLIIAVSILILIFTKIDVLKISEDKFSDCKIVVESCLTEECKYYFLCSGELSLTNCKVYDCGGEYGVLMEKEGGKILTLTKPKPNLQETQKVVDKCRGEIEIIDKKCEDGSLKINLKIKTVGECEISAFLADLGEKKYIQPLWKKEGNIFQLSISDNCDVAQIIAIGQGGVAIKKSLK